MGGIAAGFLWTAQGAYFSRNAALYAEAAGISKEQATLTFAGWFALPYLGFEVVFKLLQSYIGLDSGPLSAGWAQGKNFIYVINTICAVLAVFGCLRIMPLKEDDKEEDPGQMAAREPLLTIMTRQALAASKLFITDPKMPLMMSMNIAFGVTAAYINSYTTSVVATHFLGSGYAGYLAAITAGVAALLSFPLTNLGLITSGLCGMELSKETEKSFKRSAMVVGPICFALVSLLPIIMGYKSSGIGNWGGLVLLYVLQGVGRGVWEATNKAIFADYFAYDTVGGFSNMIIQNGGASTVCFFIDLKTVGLEPVGKDCTCSEWGSKKCIQGSCPAYSAMGWAGIAFSVLAVLGFVLATMLHQRGIKNWDGLLGRIPEDKDKQGELHEPLALEEGDYEGHENQK
eukprot:TRINITY_DN13575_c0_g1_i5.p1 TRINITY_DN13575_c0_g1~~TRINITY_DN13575_c0_g1_i5.p1  ORF type:complete len:401 (-),score=102.85 TRINITY_DN13575_c0_g1_i5:460-1662(-)